MNWGRIFEITVTCIASLGGVGVVVVACIRFGAEAIADRMSKKYQLTLNTELEKYKTELSKKEYVSKTRFETEFSIYKELSLSFSEMIRDINIMIPFGLASVPADEEKRKEYENNCYDRAKSSVVKAQDSLFANTAFIPEESFNSYNDLLKLSQEQLFAFERRYYVGDLVSQREKEILKPEDYERTKDLNKKWQELNKSIRDYLNKLDVID